MIEHKQIGPFKLIVTDALPEGAFMLWSPPRPDQPLAKWPEPEQVVIGEQKQIRPKNGGPTPLPGSRTANTRQFEKPDL